MFTFSTIEWDNSNRRLKILDQLKLPLVLTYLYLSSKEEVWQAIKKMHIRGAPLLGIAAAYGVILGIQESKAKDYLSFSRDLEQVINYLSTARPTAVNLFWALERMKKKAESLKEKPVEEIKSILLEEAHKILQEDKEICFKLGEYTADLLPNSCNVLTHCNAGALATAGIGTALAGVYRAVAQGKKISVYVDETRPILQGARLTAWELTQANIPVTLICDNMAAFLMQQKKIDCVLVGADRIAANGDVANKIGTYNLAVLAKYHQIPFYVIAPTSTIDLSISDGKQIPIEERESAEITEIFNKRIAPANVNAYNPAFDITPSELITAYVTEKGIVKPPFCLA